jgi:AhpD family alkylhydroperoxidase
MSTRLDHKALAPRCAASVRRLSDSVELDPRLRELINVRASQINGCSYCIALHSASARELGESDDRLLALSAWEHTPFFDSRERAALALCESVTLVSATRVPDEVWNAAAELFDDEELTNVLYAIVTINAYNRLAIATRMQPNAPG